MTGLSFDFSTRLGNGVFIEDHVRLGYECEVAGSTRIIYGAYICDRVLIGNYGGLLHLIGERPATIRRARPRPRPITSERGRRQDLLKAHSISRIATCVREAPNVRRMIRRWLLSRPSPDSAISSAAR